MRDWSRLGDALSRQDEFSSLFFEKSDLTLQQKQEMLKTFVLSLHAEATGLVEGVNYKSHRLLPDAVDIQKILYKSTDAYRYILAILNLWDISEGQFVDALRQKDEFLHFRHELSQKQWAGQPIAIFDVDDVLAEFRESFCDHASKETGIFVDPNSNEYYNTATFKAHGLKGENYFKSFVEGHGFLRLRRNETYYNFLVELKSRGYWIQILTARPESNLTCFYDTYSWLYRNDIPADGVAFAPEKFSWLSAQKFYNSAKYFAIDDSAKHSAEYAKHGVKVVVPQKPYNVEVRGLPNIFYIDNEKDPCESISNLVDATQ